MDNRTLLLTIANVLVAALTRALHDGLPGFKSLSARWRLALAAGLGIVGGAIDAVSNGSTISQALTAAIAVSGTSFALLLVEAIFAGKDVSSGEAVK